MPTLRPARPDDFDAILAVINDAAQAYKGAIPADCWHEPYMGAPELRREIADGIAFTIAESDGRVTGVMGMQDKGEVMLVRHAYVATTAQRGGIGTQLLRQVQGASDKPVLIGTWAAAAWAIGFYRRHGFEVVPDGDKEALLRRYWSVPPRQVATSVVLADARWRGGSRRPL